MWTIYIDNKYKDLIKDLNIFTHGLKDEDLHWISLKILSIDMGKNTVFEGKLNYNKSIKSFHRS